MAAVAYAAFLWWFTTGTVLYLCGLPRATWRWSLVGATLILVAALWGLIRTAGSTEVTAAWCAFTCGVLVFGWHELSYYMGLLTGPRQVACEPDCSLGRRFVLGVAVSLYHELAIILTGLGLLYLTWGEPNQVGTWTFLVLWLMRWSAKLNLFLGVPNLNEDFLPPHQRYLVSYMRRRPINLLFPVSITLGSVGVGFLLFGAFASGAVPLQTTGGILVATLLGLAILEHWFLVLPINESALWAWGFKSRKAGVREERALGTGRP